MATGSHIDAIPNAGRYDGTVGVLGGLEAIRALQRARISAAAVDRADHVHLGRADALRHRLPGQPPAVPGARPVRPSDCATRGGGRSTDARAAGFTGPLVRRASARGLLRRLRGTAHRAGSAARARGIPLGIVTAIAAPASLRISIEGEGGHAGAVLMPDRRDAFLAAAEIALAVEAAARSTGASIRSQPSACARSFPARSTACPAGCGWKSTSAISTLARRDGCPGAIAAATEHVAAPPPRYGTREVRERRRARAIGLDGRGCLAGACYKQAALARNHDQPRLSRLAVYVAIAPTAMIFIPCRGGVSHRPDEFASEGDIARGALILAHALARLAE